MVINPNPQVTTTGNGGAGVQNKLSPRDASAISPLFSEETPGLVISGRNGVPEADSAETSILDEQFAREATEFARFHILANPSASMSVQANSRPEAVFELLQGMFVE